MNVAKINKFKVGITYRTDTYTRKLGFINPLVSEATDSKPAKYRLEKNYEKWRDSNIPEEFYDNEPLSGFVLNYQVGGKSYGWEGREPKFRVLDPRGFEIEITLPNLVELTEFGMGKGKVFEGELIYIYSDGHLALINTEDSRYKELYEKDQSHIKYDGENFVVGGIYQTTEVGSNTGFYLYLGEFYDFKHVKSKSKNIGDLKKTKFFYNIYYPKLDALTTQNLELTYFRVTENLVKSKIKYFHGVHETPFNTSKLLNSIFKNKTDISSTTDFNNDYNYRSNKPLYFGVFGNHVSLPNNNDKKYAELIIDGVKSYVDLSKIASFVEYDSSNYVNNYIIGDKRYISAEYYTSAYYKEYCEKYNISTEIISPKLILSEFLKSGGVLPTYKLGTVVDGATPINGLVYQGEIGEEILEHSKKLKYVNFKGKNITKTLTQINEENRNI